MEPGKERPVVADGPGNELNEFTPDSTASLPESPTRGFKSYPEWTAARKEVDSCFVVNRVYVDITGDLIAGILLSQIDYWLPRTSIVREGRRWLAKQRKDWFDEIYITPRQYDTASKRLKDLGLVEIENWRFNGLRTQHIWLNEERLIELINDCLFGGHPKGELAEAVRSERHPRSYAKRNSGLTKSVRPITSLTTRLTKKIKKKHMGEARKKRTSPARSLACKNEFSPDFKGESQSLEGNHRHTGFPARGKTSADYKREAGEFYEANVRHGKAVDGNHRLYPSWKGFEQFWELYPDRRKRDKKESWLAWHDATRIEGAEDFEKERPFLVEILKHVEESRQSDADWLRGYAPRPVTYLSQRRWEK